MSTTTNQSVDQFLPVAVQTLFGARVADFDLYFHGGESRPLLFRARQRPLGDDDLQRLVDSGVRTLLIGSADRAAYEAHLQEQMAASENLPLAGRFLLLRGPARSIFESALRSGAGVVTAAEQVGSQVVAALSDKQPILRDVFDLLLHDYSTFTHSANVATYCTSLARQLGICNESELVQIAAGGLLHDVGKRTIPRRVLNSPRKLSASERELINRHPQTGFEELSSNPRLNWHQLMMVYQHHERLDGRGYPVGVLSDEIDRWAKICAVADVFDALTCDRPYRGAMPIQQACDFLEDRAATSFDPEIVRCLTTMMQPD